MSNRTTRSKRGYWVMQAPVISTAHLAKEVMEKLNKLLPPEEFFGTMCMPGSHGAMLFAGDGQNLDEDAPECLRQVLAWAVGEGFEWVRLDCDGDVIAGLPEYSW